VPHGRQALPDMSPVDCHPDAHLPEAVPSVNRCTRRHQPAIGLGHGACPGRGCGLHPAPQTVGEQLLVSLRGAGRITSFAPQVGEVATGSQGVGMVGSQYPQAVGKQLLQISDSAGGITNFSPGQVNTG
jgi:hypothetical protein